MEESYEGTKTMSLVMNDQKGDTPMLPVIITETPRRVLSNSIVYNHVAYIDVNGDYWAFSVEFQ